MNICKVSSSNSRGITLMSLAITIVVLLILAGITISLALDDNGVLKQSKLAKATYENSASQEQSDLNSIEREIDGAIKDAASSGNSTSGGGSSGGSSSDSDYEEKIKELQDQINDLQKENEDLKSENDRLNDENSDLASKQAVGNATPEQVLYNATFSNSNNIGLTGTMNNRADTTTAWSGYETISVEPHPADNTQGLVTIINQYGTEGFYSKNSKITGNIANLNAANIKAGVNVGRVDGTAGIIGTFTSDGTATADNISNGKVAYVNGQRIVGNGAGESSSYNSGYNNGYNGGYSGGYNAGVQHTKSGVISKGYSQWIDWYAKGGSMQINVAVSGYTPIGCGITGWGGGETYGTSLSVSLSGNTVTLSGSAKNNYTQGSVYITVYYLPN